ncbi:cache domain-containing protein [Tamaricihabitans halophyticus]|uniref:cache domain-containing protein n=1 Tax=Tamaricihabitans halophyticus TaxID=1262583 RepID=UPI0014046EB9|nr:cache domain-containing protein [Tamaricihabitans halophyticus]
MSDVRAEEMSAAAREVGTALDEVFAWLAELAGRFAAMHASSVAEQNQLRAADLSQLRASIFPRLTGNPRLLAGTGVIVADDVLADQPHWLEWWQHAQGGTELEFLEVDHDPASVGFYDYESAAWFVVPRDTGDRVVVGPYVDYSGTDEYMLTLAHPVSHDARFLGVAAADIRADAFEALLLRAIGAVGQPAVLANEAGRVIASNTPSKIAGSLVHEAEFAGSPVRVVLNQDAEVRDCAGLPWRIAALRG